MSDSGADPINRVSVAEAVSESSPIIPPVVLLPEGAKSFVYNGISYELGQSAEELQNLYPVVGRNFNMILKLRAASVLDLIKDSGGVSELQFHGVENQQLIVSYKQGSDEQVRRLGIDLADVRPVDVTLVVLDGILGDLAANSGESERVVSDNTVKRVN